MLILTRQQQQHVHEVLNKALIGINGTRGYIGLEYGDDKLNISEEEGAFLRAAMQNMGLLINHDGPGENGLSQLTTQGVSVARSPGGYLAQQAKESREKQLQRQEAKEASKVNMLVANATVDSAKWAKISGLIALIAIAISLYSIYDTKQEKEDNDALKTRIEALERKIQVTKP